jgi:hypothetical protein
MNRIEALVQRYDAAASLMRNGVEIVAVADPVGARYSRAVRRLLLASRDDPGLWEDLIRPARILRWRQVTQPLPTGPAPGLRAAAREVIRQAKLLRGAVADDGILDDLSAVALEVAESQTPLSDTLYRLIDRTGPTQCAVVAASRPAQVSLSAGWGELGIRVLTAAELAREEICIDQAYAIGPPAFFGASLVTAPAAFAVSFLIPAWVQDRAVPSSAIARYADSGAIQVRSRIRAEASGEGGYGTDESDVREADAELAGDLLPQAGWTPPRAPLREPGSEEVTARKVLLSGSLAIWLDDSDGERIRTVDPSQPSGERVMYSPMDTVQPGTYLLLRRGETERGAVSAAALRLLGPRAGGIVATQHKWKERLTRRIESRGQGAVAADLRRRGVKTADRARAWTDPYLIRPQDDAAFRQLLEWLDIPVEPSYGNATTLRRTTHRVTADIRDQLQAAVDAADLARLVRDGHLSIETRLDGFRGMIATRVLAISPYAEIIPRHEARVPFTDRSAQWLE